jgi:RNA recognition motif-containing protein
LLLAKGGMGMTKLFVGNLSSEVTPVDLRAAFAAYGQVTAAHIVLDRSNGTSRGFGFIEMTSHENATAAMRGLDGTDLKGRRMHVNRARPRSEGERGNAPRGWAVVGEARNRW